MRCALKSFAVLAALTLFGCSRNTPKPEPEPVAASALKPAPASSAEPLASAPAASASVPLAPPPICTVESKKVWSSGANKLTGLTEAELADGRVALGFAVGNHPHVLLVSKAASGKVVRVALKQGTQLASPPKPAEGSRQLMRVTPVKVEGDEVRAFADFRDEFKDKRRRVACGPADSDEFWVAFDDVPFFARQDRSEAVAKKLFASAGGAEATYHEIRDCRTFTDPSTAETWILGSGLHGTLKADNSMSWKSTLFVDTGAKSHETHLHSVDLKGETPKPIDYEVPVSRRLKDGSFLVATRNGSRLLTAILNPDKTLQGEFVSLAGFPTLPDLAEDGDDLVLSTSVAQGKGDFGLRAFRLSSSHPKLPRSYSVVETDTTVSGSESDPDFTRDTRGRRWIAHVEGERGNGRLSIAPIDAAFRVQGRPYSVTEEGERASSARLIAMRDGGILVAFLRDKDGSTELVTEDLHCDPSR
jgi:hypothetical protein